MVKIAPSILTVDFNQLEEEIKDVVALGADVIHVDVMDGKFVKNNTPGLEMLKVARRTTNIEIDTHLMIENPEKCIDDFIQSDIITFHIEAVTDDIAEKIIRKIHRHKKKVGIAIKPCTSVDEIKRFINKVDMILVMTVEPGYSGQKMIEECLEKVKEIRRMNETIDIEVDGGVNEITAENAKKAGANILVAGSAIFSASDRKAIIKKLRS